MKTISIDIETYSDQPLPKTGVYRYVESPLFEILLFSYSVDGGPVKVVDLACGETIPQDILDALEDESVIKWALPTLPMHVALSVTGTLMPWSSFLMMSRIRYPSLSVQPSFPVRVRN